MASRTTENNQEYPMSNRVPPRMLLRHLYSNYSAFVADMGTAIKPQQAEVKIKVSPSSITGKRLKKTKQCRSTVLHHKYTTLRRYRLVVLEEETTDTQWIENTQRRLLWLQEHCPILLLPSKSLVLLEHWLRTGLMTKEVLVSFLLPN